MTAVLDQGENHRKTVAGATAVTKCARLIVSQQDISTIKEIPNLPEHQSAAKKQSNDWLNDIWPLIIKTTADIIDYANTFQATYDELVKLVPQLEDGDEQAKDQFVNTLHQVLLPALQDKETVSQSIVDKIKTFDSNFVELYQKFASDFNEANEVMTADKPQIVALQKEVNVWKDKAAHYEQVIVAAAIALPMTTSGTALLSETGVGVIIGGILMIGELAALGTELGMYASAMKQVNSLLGQLHQLESQVAELSTIESQITGLKQNTDTIITASTSVAQAWIALHADMDNTIKHLQLISPADAAIVIKSELATANADWKVVLEQAKVLQPDGGELDKKEFDSSDDMVKAIEDQVPGAPA